MKNLIRIICLFFVLGIFGCKAYSQDFIPYVMSGEFVMEEGCPDYSICGVDFYLMNKSPKDISSMNIVFYLFDKDGEPACECRSKISVEIEKNIDGGEACSFCMSLDRFMAQIPLELLYVDYLYIAKIQYEDGSVWEDPYGLVAFK